ncbi:MAG: geranylgeranylglyceryl/heptaprenylglyceryl phosphate synthase [Thermoplasmata archaeon]|nr:geranylgeranylglyceryl/heptaprenylglyceryl phosphate synthase [Euryarchaeota archaeon]RLF66493.1 MAG: geranylgeranylglyceryl/heptaprenylglyceryl phosphate synthase [Thermoplasmata archaeon]
MTLLDPEKVTPESAAKIAELAYSAGTDAIMVGGSTGFTREHFESVVLSIKESVDIPVIIFPSGEKSLTGYADAIFFMSLLNSSDREMIIGIHVRAARIIKSLGLEILPMGYVVIEPGMTVGRVGKAMLIPRDEKGIELLKSYALVTEFLGMKYFYVEAGSGAPEPAPPDMIKAVRDEIGITLIVGGGIRRPDQAREIRSAGADVIVTGTIVEEQKDIYSALKGIVNAIKSR